MTRSDSLSTSGKRMQRNSIGHSFPARPLTLLAMLVWMIPAAVGQVVSENDSDELFVFRPDTPERQVRGALLAEKLDRPALAKGYLEELMDSQPNTELLQQLRRQFGMGTFLKLSAIRELQPTSRELLQLINEASRDVAPSASTVELLIADLGQTKQQTLDASLKILSAEAEAVVPLLAADVSTPQGDLADRLLRKYIRRFRGGLLQALPDADETTQARILNLLAGCADPEMAVDLSPYRYSAVSAVRNAANSAHRKLTGSSASTESREEVAESIIHQVTNLLQRANVAFPTRPDRSADRWLQAVPADQPVVYGVGFLSRAVELSSIVERIVPDRADVLAVKMVAELTEQSWPPVWPAEMTPADSTAKAIEIKEIDVLAMKVAVATGNTASILSLLRRGPVAAAVIRELPTFRRQLLLHPDSRVRLLTAGVLVTSETQNYRADEMLAAAVSGSEKSEAVVIDSRHGEGPTVAAVINDVGYATVASRTGQGGFGLATGQMQNELLLVHSNCLRWPLSQTIANLRADYRTRRVPLVVYGPERDRSRSELARSAHAGVWFVSEPVSDEISNIDQFLGDSGRVTDPTIVTERFRLEGIPRAVLTEEERRQMIAFARNLQ